MSSLIYTKLFRLPLKMSKKTLNIVLCYPRLNLYINICNDLSNKVAKQENINCDKLRLKFLLMHIHGTFSDLENIFSVILGHTLDRKLTSLMAKSLVHGY